MIDELQTGAALAAGSVAGFFGGFLRYRADTRATIDDLRADNRDSRERLIAAEAHIETLLRERGELQNQLIAALVKLTGGKHENA